MTVLLVGAAIFFAGATVGFVLGVYAVARDEGL
jgi:hypothetical protein